MSTVAANTQTTVALTPGQQMTVRGNGMAFYGPGPLNAQPVTILNVATFGPFADRSQAVTLLAGPSGMTYNVFNGSAVPARATVGASGASDGGLMSPDGDPIIQIPPQPDLPTLIAAYPASSNAGKSALAGALLHFCNGVVWQQAGGNVPRTASAKRMAGLTQGADSTTTTGRCSKFEAEAPFSRVRFRIYCEGAASTNYKMVAAVTETAENTTAKLSHPHVGGTAYSALRAEAGAPGWATVTVGGVSNFDFPGAGAADAPKELVTDWVDLRSIPRTDGGTLPLVMIRVQHDGTANGPWSSTGGWDTWASEAAGQPWYRVAQHCTISGGGHVDDLTKTAVLANTALWCAPEFDYDVPASTVLGVSDSNLENHGGNALGGTYGTWGLQACALISSTARPVSWFNCGRAGGTSSIFVPDGVTEILRLRPSVVVYGAFTPNDVPISAVKIDALKSRLASIKDACATAGSKLIVYTGIPKTGYDASADALRLSLTTHVESMASRGLLTHVDFESTLGAGTTPNAFAAGMDIGDGLHVSRTAATLMAAKIAPVIAALIE